MYNRTQADRIDMRQLRDILKNARVSQREYAEACKLSATWISLVLNGHERPGELGTIKMQRGLAALGLPQDCCVTAEREVCSYA
ncbi:MAG: hypothetical protein ACXWQZ_06095 [Ktedonobacterales bacterium]